jgi:hypothetical protein
MIPPNAARNAAILAAHERGLGVRAIARTLALTPGVAAGCLFRAGLCRPTPRKGRYGARCDRIRFGALALAADKGGAAAAREFGVCGETVQQWRRKAGVW